MNKNGPTDGYNPKISSENLEKILKKIQSKENISFLIFLGVILLFFLGPLIIVILPLIYFSVIMSIKGHIRHRNFMKQFASDHNFDYLDRINHKELKGRLFKFGNSKIATTAVLGKQNDRSIKIFNYRCTTGSGKNSQTHRFTVCEIEIKKTQFPHIFLKSDSMRRYQKIDFFGSDKDVRIKLENDLDKYFDLYCTQDYEIETLEIFTIDLLNLLKEKGPHLSIEFSDNKIYFYDDLVITKRDDLDKLYLVVKEFLDKKGLLLARLQDDFEAMHQSYRIN